MQTELGCQETGQDPFLVHYAYVARYEYSDTVVQNDNFLMVSPYTDQYQADCSHQIQTIPHGSKVRYPDRLKNTVHRASVRLPHQELIIAAFGEVWLKSHSLEVSDVALGSLAYDGDCKEFLDPSPLVDPPSVSEAAREVENGSESLLETVHKVTSWVHEHVEYGRGSTNVGTTAAQVLAGRKGVCQDKTHLALGMLRALGIPSRYVSGLLTRQAGETHAWLEFLHPELGWLPADPTRGVILNTDKSYLKFAVGRDYTEVPPVAGSFVSTGSGQLMTALAQVFFDKDQVSLDDALMLLEPNPM